MKNIANQNKGGHFEFALTPEEKKRLWSARKESLWSTIAVKGEGMEVYSTDVAVPLSRLPDLIGKHNVKSSIEHLTVICFSKSEVDY